MAGVAWNTQNYYKIQILCDPQFQGFPTIHYIEFLSDVILYIYVV